MKIGNFATRKKITARLLFQRVGLPLVDLGNLKLLKHEPKVDRAQQMTYESGSTRVTHEEPSQVDWRWSVKGDERITPTLELLTLAREVLTKALVDQRFTTDPASPAQGDVLDVGRQFITNVRYTGDNDENGDPATEGVEYKVDYAAGKITILSAFFTDGGSIPAWTFDVYAQTAKNGAQVNLGNGVLAGDEKAYALGAFNVSNLTIHDEENDVDLNPGTQYTLDAANGMVTLIGYGSAGSLIATFDQPAILVKTYTVLSEAFVQGTAMLIHEDIGENGTPGAPREVATFPAELSISDWGDNDGTKFNDFQITLAATAAPSILCRES